MFMMDESRQRPCILCSSRLINQLQPIHAYIIMATSSSQPLDPRLGVSVQVSCLGPGFSGPTVRCIVGSKLGREQGSCSHQRPEAGLFPSKKLHATTVPLTPED